MVPFYHLSLACEQACRQTFGTAVPRSRCALDPDASYYWREHLLLTCVIDIGF